jgi:sugar transferase (PEP-CTERM/EpsH1 system associated)
MQILFLTHRLPYPPDKGERIRAFHELKYLAGRHEVDLFCFADSQADAVHQKACREICRSVHVETLRQPGRFLRAAWAGLCDRSMSAAFFYSPVFAEAVRQALRQHRHDLIFVYCSSMGQYVPSPSPARLVVDFVDADSAKWQQYAGSCRPPRSWLYAREARAVAACERTLGSRAALSLAVTQHDARELCGAARNQFPVEVMANGVEVPTAIAEVADTGLRRLQPFDVFVGTMNYRPNSDAAEHFARDIFPLLRRQRPELNFVVVGRNPDRKVQRLAKLPGVTVTGTVPDVYQYFRHAEISVAPFRISQGFHNKIAESLAVGTPVVTSSRAVAGIGLSEHEGLFAADNPQQFAETVNFVLANFLLRRKFRESAPAVRKQLSWESRLRRLEELMSEVVSRPADLSPTILATK